MKHKYFSIRREQATALVLLFFVISYLAVIAQTDAPTVKDKIKTNLQYLAGEDLEGRFPGTDGNYKAADYISKQFQKAGLVPAGATYLQEFPFVTGLNLGKNNSMEFKILIEKPGVPKEMLKPSTKKWEIIADYKPIRFSENGKAEGEVFFAGYGITAPDKDYDDYAGIDVKGKIVIVLADSAEGKPIDKFFTQYADLRWKAMNAREHGAVAIIFVKTLSDSANTYYAFKPESMMKNSGIIAVQANRLSISKFFPKEKPFLKLEQDINKTHKPQSIKLVNTSAVINVEIEEEKKNISNVIGMVKGNNPALADNYIIVGAHYDHLGFGDMLYPPRNKKPEVYHGADDNASGTCTVIELAERFARNPISKSIIFMAFNAEEEGLKGSSYYTRNPLVPLEKAEFMLNFDMVGRLKDDKIFVLGSGTSNSLPGLVDETAKLDSVNVVKVNEGFAPSDNSSFYAEKIPAIMIFSGVHTDYHKPSDDESKINYQGIERIVNYSERLIRAIGNNPQRLDYKKVEGDANGGYQQKQGETKGAWLGIVPNFEENANGFMINGASAGSPAEKAGLKKDDIITKIGDKSIKGIRDLTFVLKEHRPGDTVIINILRNGKEQKVSVTLGQK
jgi:hypothetical protein